MRKLLIAGMAFLFIGCMSTEPMQETIYTTGYDFSEYTDQGFLFTPEQYLDDYQSIGLITTTMWPRVYESPTGGTDKDGNPTYDWVIGDMDVDKAIEELYNQATSMGADAITRFNIQPTYRMNGNLRVPGAEISGFAIKRPEQLSQQ